MHPDHRISFLDWAKRIDDKLATGERFFEKREGLFDAMPAVWKKMDVVS